MLVPFSLSISFYVSSRRLYSLTYRGCCFYVRGGVILSLFFYLFLFLHSVHSSLEVFSLRHLFSQYQIFYAPLFGRPHFYNFQHHVSSTDTKQGPCQGIKEIDQSLDASRDDRRSQRRKVSEASHYQS